MNKFYPKLILTIMLIFSVSFSYAQLTGIKNIPGDYATLNLAITDLNTQGVGAGGVTLNLLTGNPETAPAGGYTITATGTIANPIQIVGNNNTITASAGHTAGALNDGVFKIIGADYVTLTGFNIIENPLNTVTNAATNNMTEWGIALLYATTTDGAQNVTIQSCLIDLDRTYQNTFGIYSNSTHSATTVGTTATATTSTGSNSSLVIYSNTITDVNIGIVVVGPTAAADHNDVVDIGGSSITTGNTITNYGTTGTFSTYANVSGTVNGILVRNTRNFNISYNSVTSSNGGTTAGTLRGIYVPAFSNAPTGTIVNSISHNSVSVSGAAAAGTINGIHIEGTSANATTTLNINNNNFHNFGHTVAATGTVNLLINASPALITNVNNNTFTNISLNTTGSVVIIQNNVTRPASAIVNANNNSIVTGFTKTGAGGTLTFYNSNSLSPATGSEVNDGNNFSNITVNGATTVAGWVSTDGSTTAPFGPGKTITNNIFNNITGGTNTVTILNVGYSNSGSSTNNVSGNTISNISGGGAVTCITSAGGSQNMFNNIINTVSSTGGSNIIGMGLTGGAIQNIYNNKIYGITSNNSGGAVFAINVGGTTANLTANVYNNLIGELFAPITNLTTDAIRGISITNTSTNGNINISSNSIHINASSSGTNFSTSAIFHTTSATATTGVLNLRNNILVNTSAASGTGITSAYRRSSATLSNFGSVSNNNLFYTGTPSATNVIFYDGTTTYQTLTDYQLLVTPIDASSISELPPFVSTAGVSSNFLHIDQFTLTGINNGGINVAGIVDDFDGDIRFGNPGYTGGGTAPDIGADEYNLLLALDMGVSMLLEPSSSGCHSSSDTVRLRIVNYSNQTIDFSINPVTISSSATGVNPMVFPVITLNTDTLTSFGSIDTTVFIGYDMSALGTYTFNANTTLTGDGDNGNNAMPVTNIVISGGTISLSDSTEFCSGELVDLSITGQTNGGTIQWQQSTNGGALWTNVPGGTLTPFSVSPIDTTLYRAQVCGSTISNIVTAYPIVVFEPTASDITRCGPGMVTLTATSNGSISWYDAPVGGTLIDTGSSINVNVLATTNYYPQANLGVGIETGGQTVPLAASTGFTGNDYGLVFDALQPFTLVSVDVFPTASAGTITIELVDNIGTVIQTSGPLNFPAGTGTTYGAGATAVTLPLNFSVPVGTSFELRSASHSGNIVRDNPIGAFYNFPIPIGSVGVLTSGLLGGSANANTYYYFYNWQVDAGGCSSDRDTVTVTVTPSDTVTAAVVTNPICSNGSTIINANSVNTNYQYTWSPAAGLSSTTGASVTTTSDTTITYTIHAFDPGTTCESFTFTTVTVNPAPTVNITTPDTALCINSSLQIDGLYSAAVNNTGTIGFNTTNNTATSTTILGPYGGLYGGAKHQYLYTAADLTGAGLTAGPISQLAFDVANINSVPALADYTIKMDTTSLNVLTAGYAPAGQTVYYNPSYTPTTGWNYHTFSNNFVWDGVSNIIVEVCFNNNNAGAASGNASVRYTNTTGINTVNYYRADNDPNVCAMLSGTQTINRPNILFSSVAPVSFQWTPATNLNNDTIINPVLTAATGGSYTITVTDDINGCSETDNISVTVNPLPVFSIGNDTLVCSNLALTPFPAFASDNTLNYLWFDGAITTGTLINGTGTFWATGTDANGCSNTDTLVVGTVDPATVDINIDVTGTNTADLDAGSGYSSYLWSNSATTQTTTVTGNGTYFVQVTDANGCPNADTVSIVFSLGIDENDNSTLSFYPNPSTGIINMAGTGLNGKPLKVEIMSISGQMVYQQNIEEPGENFIQQIDLSAVAEGTYVVRVINDQRSYTSRIVIVRN